MRYLCFLPGIEWQSKLFCHKTPHWPSLPNAILHCLFGCFSHSIHRQKFIIFIIYNSHTPPLLVYSIAHNSSLNVLILLYECAVYARIHFSNTEIPLNLVFEVCARGLHADRVQVADPFRHRTIFECVCVRPTALKSHVTEIYIYSHVQTEPETKHDEKNNVELTAVVRSLVASATLDSPPFQISFELHNSFSGCQFIDNICYLNLSSVNRTALHPIEICSSRKRTVADLIWTPLKLWCTHENAVTNFVRLWWLRICVFLIALNPMATWAPHTDVFMRQNSNLRLQINSKRWKKEKKHFLRWWEMHI